MSSLRNGEYVNFMVDTETLGLQPNSVPLLEIAVLPFNPVTFETGEGFSAWLPIAEQVIAGKKPNQSTVDWWDTKVNPEVRDAMLAGTAQAKPVRAVLEDLYAYITQHCRIGPRKYLYSRFWAKPAAFDFPFVDGAFQDQKLESPFNFRNVVDMSSYIKGMFQGYQGATIGAPLTDTQLETLYWKSREYMPKQDSDSAHSALADCMYQVQWLEAATRNCKLLIDSEN